MGVQTPTEGTGQLGSDTLTGNDVGTQTSEDEAGRHERGLKDLTQVDGVKFPKYAETVVWSNGYKTYLPWASDDSDPMKNMLAKVKNFSWVLWHC